TEEAARQDPDGRPRYELRTVKDARGSSLASVAVSQLLSVCTPGLVTWIAARTCVVMFAERSTRSHVIVVVPVQPAPRSIAGGPRSRIPGGSAIVSTTSP